MPVNRRDFLTLAAGAGMAAGLLAGSRLVRAATPAPIGAVALDGFTTFDPRPLVARAERLFPGQGQALALAWRTRQFEYTWLRTLMGRYTGFWQITEEALGYAAAQLRLPLSGAQRDELMQGYRELRAWPDAAAALQRLRAAGVRLAFLSNFSVEMLDTAVHGSGLDGLFEPHLSTDRVQAFKPDPRAYQMGVDAFALPRERIAFAAFGGWDAAGAKSFGYPTYWVNRLGVPLEQLGISADASGPGLDGLVAFVLGAPRAQAPA
ncbi:haloacid dehalogenase type II [Plasticicumulans acidivorans]|uniref:(S)-2-haloacid dehalogenase n=1 Tax=Plasticicumulans acidivorans TaxID=886464 RepID=A0A317N2V5_9GAMM|nr:haloacid dehalogenase type II [Plasticicumulans acidivorans]PWV64477.1 2-haloacid dehalogenase [Plasticicumulans acidivorans]